MHRGWRIGAEETPMDRSSIIGEQLEGELDQGIIAAEWLSYEAVLACRAQHRSPMVMQCIDDFRNGPGYPLDVISQEFS